MSDVLWAPWRMEYIRAPKDDACLFCTLAGLPDERRRDALVLDRGPHALVVLNRYPFAAGHLLVVPLRHAADLDALPEAEHDELFRVVRRAAARLREAVTAGGLNVGLNLGVPAGAGIADHLHVHLVPRWSGDTNFMPVLADVRVMPEALAATYDHLAPRFAGVAAPPTSP